MFVMLCYIMLRYVMTHCSSSLLIFFDYVKSNHAVLYHVTFNSIVILNDFIIFLISAADWLLRGEGFLPQPMQ